MDSISPPPLWAANKTESWVPSRHHPQSQRHQNPHVEYGLGTSVSFLCCIANYYNLSSSKQHPFVISVSVARDFQHNLLGFSAQRSHKAATKELAGLCSRLDTRLVRNSLPSLCRIPDGCWLLKVHSFYTCPQSSATWPLHLLAT